MTQLLPFVEGLGDKGLGWLENSAQKSRAVGTGPDAWSSGKSRRGQGRSAAGTGLSREGVRPGSLALPAE